MNDLELLRGLYADAPDREAAERASRFALHALRADMDAPARTVARKRLPRRRLAFAVAGVFALFAIGALVLDGSRSSLTPTPGSALAISRQADRINLRIADASASAEDMTRELNDAGIRGRVVLVPVPPDYVGVWILTSETGTTQVCMPRPGQKYPEREPNVRLHEIERVPDSKPKELRIPVARVRESTGEFLFVAGRAAKPGEQPIDAGSTEAEDQLLETLLPPIAARQRALPPPCPR